jgi:hypothetical protein
MQKFDINASRNQKKASPRSAAPCSLPMHRAKQAKPAERRVPPHATGRIDRPDVHFPGTIAATQQRGKSCALNKELFGTHKCCRLFNGMPLARLRLTRQGLAGGDGGDVCVWPRFRLILWKDLVPSRASFRCFFNGGLRVLSRLSYQVDL